MAEPAFGQAQADYLHLCLFSRHLCRDRDVLSLSPAGQYGDQIVAHVAKTLVTFTPSVGTAIPVPDHDVDVVICFGLTSESCDYAGLRSEIRRVLRDGGRVVTSTLELVGNSFVNVAHFGFDGESRSAAALVACDVPLESNLAAWYSEAGHLDRVLARLERQAIESEDDHAKLADAYQRLWSEVVRQRRECDFVNHKLKVVLNSTSWRITAPLRSLAAGRSAPQND